jgi:hypothetical protein
LYVVVNITISKLPVAEVLSVAQRPHDKEERGVTQNDSSGEQHAKRVARRAHPWIERLARSGYVAYGVFMFVMARYRRIEPV